MRGLAIAFLTLESVAASDCVREFFFGMLIDHPIRMNPISLGLGRLVRTVHNSLPFERSFLSQCQRCQAVSEHTDYLRHLSAGGGQEYKDESEKMVEICFHVHSPSNYG
jgi:hypothetical protein